MQGRRPRRGALAILLLTVASTGLVMADDNTTVASYSAQMQSVWAAASSNPTEAQRVQQLQATVAAVAAANSEVEAALADVPAAFEAYMQRLGAVTGAGTVSPSAAAMLPAAVQVLAADVVTPEGRSKRQAIFEANLKEMVKLNKQLGPNMAVGINDFTHLTNREAGAMYTQRFVTRAGKASTRRRPSQSCRGNKLKPLAGDCGNSPTCPQKFDWRDANAVTPIRHQHKCGSCAAFSTIAATETAWIVSKQVSDPTTVDLSEQELLDCTRGNQCAGAWPEQYMQMIACSGVSLESEDPYKVSDNNNCPSTQRHDSGVVGYSSVGRTSLEMRQALHHSPMMITVKANVDWFLKYKGGVIDCADYGATPDHALIVVGYEDNVKMPDGQTWDIFYLKNSWGTGWGEKGYMRMRDCSNLGRRSVGAANMFRNAPLIARRF